MAWHQTDLVQGKSNLVSVQEDIVTGYFELDSGILDQEPPSICHI